tara:strand:- start:12765 stop:15806 length:3042 start_codon:yes stop_codon:yes gene_type:complete
MQINHKHVTTLFIFIIVLFFYSCKDKELDVDYNTLSEKEKREPKNALSSMEVAENLKLSLFASEPMMANPTNMAIDAKGRIWICEGRNYRDFANKDNPIIDKGDRILILEDTTGDGKADLSKVFYQGNDINSALGITVLGTKVIVSSSPNVFVFTDEDGDDIPDSKTILYKGIEGKNHDHGAHSFVFGPDGRLYFNFGNNGKKLRDKDDNFIIDIHGDSVIANNKPYKQGMAFRSELDGSKLEILADNFRNPYELAVDSYGRLWQTDNDDDGNRATRVNHVLEYGNYGYTSKLTGENWRKPRVGLEKEIPERHWHTNDPGTVPNVLLTGSGSPCGIIVYEDNLLPKIYQNQLIHCEPGHGVVRSYLINSKAAGYEAKIKNMITSTDDWFRPSDIAVAPDGSLYFADWYDGGVGGHKAEDVIRGRIYHITPKETPTFKKTAPLELDPIDGLVSGNMDVYYQSWQKLHVMQIAADPILKKLIVNGGLGKLRALWIGAKIPEKKLEYINLAISDPDENIRMQGIKMAKYVAPNELEYILEKIVNDKSATVRREAAIALRHIGTPKAAELWTQLAMQHTGDDRWYIEALGIGADLYADLYFNAWKAKVENIENDKGSKDIVWRIHAKESTKHLFDLIKNPEVKNTELASYFRALDFKKDKNKDNTLLSLLTLDLPLKKEIKKYTLTQLDKDFVNKNQHISTLVSKELKEVKGTPEWLMALHKFKLKDVGPSMLTVITNASFDTNIRKETMQLLFDFNKSNLLDVYLGSNALESEKMNVLSLLNGVNDTKAIKLLTNNITKKTISVPVKRSLIEALGNSRNGQKTLFSLLKEGKLEEIHKRTAVLKLMGSYDSIIRTEAPSFLSKSNNEVVNIDKLIAKTGNLTNGKKVFSTYCATCHIAADEGVDFGPNLSDIGNKLAKNFMYTSIIYPSAGINFGYEGYTITMKDGTIYSGYLLSRTEDDLTINMLGNIKKQLKRDEIVSEVAMEKSLMPGGLDKIMSEKDFIDLIEYMTALKIAS